MEGYLDLGGGLWQCLTTSKPFSSRGKSFKELTAKNKEGYFLVKIEGKVKRFHRIVYEYYHGEIPNQYTVDHRDRNPLNNHISNLRLATHQQQQYNQNKRRDCSSIFKGVYWNKASKKWVAQIQINGKRKHLGYFQTQLEAALAFDEAVKEYNIPNCTTNKELGLL